MISELPAEQTAVTIHPQSKNSNSETDARQRDREDEVDHRDEQRDAEHRAVARLRELHRSADAPPRPEPLDHDRGRDHDEQRHQEDRADEQADQSQRFDRVHQ